MKNNIAKIKNKKDGYTLIEVIIALTITSVAFVAIYALFARSMQSSAENRYEGIAAALAQESIEIIKNKREFNEMKWATWKRSDGTPPTSFTDIDNLTQCNPSLDWTAGYSFTCVGGNNINMRYNKNNLSKEYQAGCSGGDCTGPVFKRSCDTMLIDTDADTVVDSLQARCTVRWDSLLLGGGERSVSVENLLTDWER